MADEPFRGISSLQQQVDLPSLLHTLICLASVLLEFCPLLYILEDIHSFFSQGEMVNLTKFKESFSSVACVVICQKISLLIPLPHLIKNSLIWWNGKNPSSHHSKRATSDQLRVSRGLTGIPTVSAWPDQRHSLGRTYQACESRWNRYTCTSFIFGVVC